MLNGPFTIWALSVVAVGLFGAMYDDVRYCRTEAQHAALSYRRLGIEIANRLDDLNAAISGASSMDEVRAAGAIRDWDQQYTFLEYKGRTLTELEDEYVREGRKLLHFPSLVLDLLSERLDRAVERYEAAGKGDVSPVLRIDLYRPDFSKLTDAELPALKK